MRRSRKSRARWLVPGHRGGIVVLGEVPEPSGDLSPPPRGGLGRRVGAVFAGFLLLVVVSAAASLAVSQELREDARSCT